MKGYIAILASVLLLAGCVGGGGGDSTSTNIIKMELGETYTVYPNDMVVKDSEDAVVKITHTEGETTSTVELLEGEASIVKNN
jgi:PBP1b-binding outer membrane lipoprotein LpoB